MSDTKPMKIAKYTRNGGDKTATSSIARAIIRAVLLATQTHIVHDGGYECDDWDVCDCADQDFEVDE